MISAMELRRWQTVMVGLFWGLLAGCSGRSNPGGTGVGVQSSASVNADGGPATGDAGQDAGPSTCGETIDQYCQSDGSTCLAGVPRDWTSAKQQASNRCDGSHRVYFQQCTGYGVLNAASAGDDTVFFYDLTTSMLVRVDHIQFGGPTDCIAGVNLAPVDCSSDGASPTYLCTASDAGAD